MDLHDLESILYTLRPKPARSAFRARLLREMEEACLESEQGEDEGIGNALAQSTPRGPRSGLRQEILEAVSEELEAPEPPRRALWDRLASSPRVWLAMAASVLIVFVLGAVLETRVQSRLDARFRTETSGAVEAGKRSGDEIRQVLSGMAGDSAWIKTRVRRRLARPRRMYWTAIRSGPVQ